MKAVQLHDLPYRPDSEHWFACVRPLGDAVWLDSAFPHSRAGRYDIISAAPLAIFEHEDDDVFEAIKRGLVTTFDNSALADPSLDLPFQGGAIALIGYDIGRKLQNLPTRGAWTFDPQNPQPAFPAALTGLYSWAVITDHQQRRTRLLIRPETPAPLAAALLDHLKQPQPAAAEAFQLTSPWREEFERAAYRRSFERLQEYIRAGDCYQVNLARRFHATSEGDPFSAYRLLRATAAAPFSAYLERNTHGTQRAAIMSLSPERLLSASDRQLFTQPIKGTISRSTDREIDRQRAATLLGSEKNRAENLMIVDLLRNDLGRSCEAGSIRVERLFELQSFATVHHLVSSVSGKLRADLHPVDALRHCFPGGSVTGAPKRRAMQIIDELEPLARAVFCGAIGYISVCGRMDTNITIRTLLAENRNIFAWAGGGIVADSDCDDEFEETRSKIEPLLQALTTAD